MEHFLPEIFWHDRDALLSVDFQRGDGNSDTKYKIVTTSVQKEVRIWECVFEKCEKNGNKHALAINFIANLAAHTGTVNMARFSPNGEILASGDTDGSVITWKVSAEMSKGNGEPAVGTTNDDLPPNKENWKRMRPPLRHMADVWALCWSMDSQFLASASREVVLLNVRTGQRVWTARGFHNFVNGLTWDPREKYIVAMSPDRRMDFIDAVKGTRLLCIHSVQFAETLITETVRMKPGAYKLFRDDQLMSFMRSADFTPDGELLIAPCAHLEIGDSNIYGTYVFRRCDFHKGRPFAFLRSPKATFRAASCPLKFELRRGVKGNAMGIPYRLVWAVLTIDTVTLYDSQSALPFAYAENMHYNHLTDMSWSPDGRVLLISSLEGYCSFIRFDISLIGVVLSEVPSPPPSPQLIALKKTPRRAKHVAFGNDPSKQGGDSSKTRCVTPEAQLDVTAKVTPKRRINLISNYLTKTLEGESNTKSHEVNENGKKQVTRDTEDTRGSSALLVEPAVKPKKRAQLQTVPLIEID